METTVMTLSEARVYVGTYAKYNAGSLKGDWLDLSDYSDKDEFYEACKELHKDEEDPEFMFQDFENIPKGFIGSSNISDEIFEIVSRLDEVANEEALSVFIESSSYSEGSDIIEQFNDNFIGEFDDDIAFAWNILENDGISDSIPQHLQCYFDCEKYASDLLISDYWSDCGYYFRNF
jgi:antirestriction protein